MDGFSINLSERLCTGWPSRLVPGMFSPSGIAITKCSSVLIDWNEVIYPPITKCVIYANDSLCWLICFNSYIHCSCLNAYWNTVFSILYEDRINSLTLT